MFQFACNLASGPQNAFAGTPRIPTKTWIGVEDTAGTVFVGMEFAAPLVVGCVQLLQKAYRSAGSIAVEALAANGSWAGVKTAMHTQATNPSPPARWLGSNLAAP